MPHNQCVVSYAGCHNGLGYGMSADTQLTQACQQGDFDKAAVALDNGADPNGRDPNNQTALCWAIYNHHQPVVELLLDRGADPSLRGAMATPLAAAASHGLEAIVERLLDLGVPVDDNAEIFASMNEHHGVTAMLEHAKSNPQPRVALATPPALPPIIVAAVGGDEATIRELLNAGADCNATDVTGATALIHAAGEGHLAIVELLLARGAHTDAVERRTGANALMAASSSGNAAIVHMLLGANMAANGVNADGFTPLMHAASLGHEELVNLLLAHSADANARNNFGETALMRAAAAGWATVVEILIAAGSTLEAVTVSLQQTALMLAADVGHTAVVVTLLAHGADKTRASLAHKTAGDYARLAGHDEVESLLTPPARAIPKVLRSAVNPAQAEAATTQLIQAIWYDDLDAAAAALTAGAVVDGFGDDVPLLAAASRGSTDIVMLLLNNGATIDVKDAAGYTALAKACGGCHVDMATALLAHGAERSEEVALAASFRRHRGIMKLLDL
jgi:uncharacterized protein